MGLFGSIFKVLKKVVGGVAEAGLSTVTGGLSDSIISKIKGNNQAKLLAAAGMTGSPKAQTLKTETMIAKRLPIRGNPDAPRYDIANDAIRIFHRKQGQKAQDTLQEEALKLAGVQGSYGAAAKRARKPRLIHAKMLNLRAMATAWRDAGKPTSWQQWIKDFPIYMEAGKITRVER